jgi:hypothetical protein
MASDPTKMVSRFTEQVVGNVRGQSLTIKFDPSDITPYEKNDLLDFEDTLKNAQDALQLAFIEVGAKELSERVKRLAKMFFLTGEHGPTHDEAREIRRILGSTLNGLLGDVTIKVASTIQKRGDAAEGSTIVGAVTKDQHRQVKPYHTKHQGTVTTHHKKGLFGKTESREHTYEFYSGAIQLLAGGAGRDKGLLTIIHEATHKYALTKDYAYFDWDGTSKTPLTSKAFALNNADSYAYFTVKLAQGNGLI